MKKRTANALLHATDFSEQSEIAFAHALRLALETRAKLYVLHVHGGRKEDVPWHEYPSVRATLERWSMIEAGASRAAVGRLGIEIEKLYVGGKDVAQSIANFRMRKTVDLIVLGIGRRGRLALGPSTAERIAAAARTPTLFVPNGADRTTVWKSGRLPMQRVLVAVAKEPRSGPALARAQDLLDLLGTEGAKLTVLHVGHERDFPLLDLPTDSACEMERVAEPGNAARRILAHAESSGADLIAMTTRGPRGLLGGLWGSTTRKVLRRAPCPVLVMPDGVE